MEEDWTAPDEPTQFQIKTNLQGPVDERAEDLIGRINFKPLAFGASIATLFTKLFPYTPSMIGSLIFPSTDKTAVIQTMTGGTNDAGQSITYSAARLTKMPSITFAPNKTMFGPAEITCLVKNGASGGTAGDFFTVADSAYSEPALSPLDILTDRYTLAWGSAPAAPFDVIETDDSGIVFEPQVSLEPVKTSRGGTVNFRITDVTATIKFRPLNLTIANYRTMFPMEGASVVRGKSLSGRGDQLTVTGSAAGMPKLTIPLAAPTKGGLAFGKDGRITEVTLMALRKSSSGTLQSLFTLATV